MSSASRLMDSTSGRIYGIIASLLGTGVLGWSAYKTYQLTMGNERTTATDTTANRVLFWMTIAAGLLLLGLFVYNVVRLIQVMNVMNSSSLT